ncbi:MAG: DUF2125 domain-containing protein [Parvibaculum sp.]
MTDPVTDVRPPPARKGHWGIFLPLLAFLLLAAVYTVYWFIVAGEVRKGVEAFAARGDGDLAVSWDTFAVGGYPYRIEAGFISPTASEPDAPEAWAWRGEAAEFALLPYNLRHVIVNLRGVQTLSYRDVTAATPVRNEARATASAAWGSYVDVDGAPFGRLAIDIEELEASHHRGAANIDEALSAKRLQVHTRPAENETAGAIPDSYDMAIQADGLVLTGAQEIPVLGPAAERISAQARLRGLPRTPHVSLVELLREWQATGGTLSVSDLIVKWGPLDLSAQGDLRLDAQHRPEGQLNAKVSDFEGLLDAMVRDGFVEEREARVALAGLVLVSQFQGNRTDEVRVPVIMQGGLLYLGPLAIAKLEPLY